MSGGSRQRYEKTKPQKKLTIPMDAKAPRQPIIKTSGGAQTAYLLDASGEVGRSYGARTTPQMFVIDGDGVLRYMGGIDSIPSADPADIPKATQYVTQALAEMKSGKPVSVSTSQPYGCSVKYGS